MVCERLELGNLLLSGIFWKNSLPRDPHTLLRRYNRTLLAPRLNKISNHILRGWQDPGTLSAVDVSIGASEWLAHDRLTVAAVTEWVVVH